MMRNKSSTILKVWDNMERFQLKIPATSANLGLGFDSMGVAISKFLYVDATVSGQWAFEFDQDSLKELPYDQTNLIAETAVHIANQYNKSMPSLSIKMNSEIPLTRGLGSSSSAIVAGIELANYYCDLHLSDLDKIYIGSGIEGHPDNIGPCITGGVFVGFYKDGELDYFNTQLDGVSLITSIPDYEINTNEARMALPSAYSREEAVEQNAKNNVMLLALWNKDYETMGRLMMDDNFHEPYRTPLIREFTQLKRKTINNGAYASVISGAGSTILTLCPSEKADEVLNSLKETFDACDHSLVDVHYSNG